MFVDSEAASYYKIVDRTDTRVKLEDIHTDRRKDVINATIVKVGAISGGLKLQGRPYRLTTIYEHTVTSLVNSRTAERDDMPIFALKRFYEFKCTYEYIKCHTFL